MDLNSLILIASMVLANIGTVIGLFIWATNHAANDSRELRGMIDEMRKESKSFHDEMKTFHARLVKQDEEFKQHMMYLHMPKKD